MRDSKEQPPHDSPRSEAAQKPSPDSPSVQTPMLDWSRRTVDYLRISITDRCNERCIYCMPQGLRDWQERDEVLTYEEVLRITRVATRLGFSKFRITGGEPLVRKGAVGFLADFGRIEGVRSFGLSTNATLIEPVIDNLREAGIDSINVSLDTLDPEQYKRITLRDLDGALRGIEAAVEAGFPKVKINTVLMRGTNEDQFVPLIRFASEKGLIVRFIELMPVSSTDVLSPANFLSAKEAQMMVEKEIPLRRVDTKLGHGPAVYYETPDGANVGFIGAITNLHFCDSCNKIRMTADGKLRPCLGNHLEFDLKTVLRSGGTDDALEAVFRETLGLKPKEHDFRKQYKPGRHMTAIGG